MTDKPVIIWFRNDLRLSDHPALFAAEGRPIIPVYIYAPDEADYPIGSTSRVWLHHSLTALKKQIPLVIKCGKSLEVLQDLIQESGADTVYWNRCYEPGTIARDSKVKTTLKESGITVKSFAANLLFEPWTVLNKQNNPFQVFTPFWNACKKLPVRPPLEMSPPNLWNRSPTSLSIPELALLPKIDWDKKILKFWTPGEKGAQENLKNFLDSHVANYATDRNFPILDDGVSHLSPHLHFGEISPYQVWNQTSVEPFLRQIVWREFAYYLLYHFPYIIKKSFKDRFNNFPFQQNACFLQCWQKGLTGYPIVDAGMRQLWQTGWMHNRVRMIVGSFLVKDLLISWKEGAKWFWDTLVDADLASNTFGWQWVGGMGADAAPYFRIFNPTIQGEKFDAEGEYIKTYVPELKYLPKQWIHRPFEAPQEELRKAGITLGSTYPFPIVDHQVARDKALELFKEI